MTPLEKAAWNGHVTGELHVAESDAFGIYAEDPVEGRSIIGWLAALLFGVAVALIILW